MRLWRPVGQSELDLIEQSGWRAFPPRLPDQPIFYPVLNFDYAEQVARDWNSKRADHDFKGFVTEFDVADKYASQFRAETVGAKTHKELWVPAEELDEFNAQIEGPIRLVARYLKGVRSNQ